MGDEDTEVDAGDEEIDTDEEPEAEADEVDEVAEAGDEAEQPAVEVDNDEQVDAEADEEQAEQQAEVPADLENEPEQTESEFAVVEDEGEDPIESGISLLNIPADEETYNVTCAVCFCRYCTHVAKPCEHLCICTECVDEMKLKAREYGNSNPLFGQLRCPMCSQPVTTFQIM